MDIKDEILSDAIQTAIEAEKIVIKQRKIIATLTVVNVSLVLIIICMVI